MVLYNHRRTTDTNKGRTSKAIEGLKVDYKLIKVGSSLTIEIVETVLKDAPHKKSVLRGEINALFGQRYKSPTN